MKPNSSVFQPCCVLALTRLSYCTLQCIWSIKLILSLPFLIHMLQVFVIRQLSVEMILFPCYSSALFCHMLCLIVADWSIEEQHFCSFCVCYFWWKRSCRSTLHVLACTCVFSQSSRSINVPIYWHTIRTPPQCYPPSSELSSEKVGVCECVSKELPGSLLRSSLKIFFVEGHFLYKTEKR